MRIKENPFWIYYLGDNDPSLDNKKCGKWMYFFNDRAFIQDICSRAIGEDIVEECKHSNAEDGVACFYLNDDDIIRHKRVINFFISNDLIRKTKAGKFYNISFKRDTQTRAGEYGDKYQSDIKLDRFLNLDTGEWLED